MMRHRLLGGSGLRVSEMCLGTMVFGEPSWGCSRDESESILQCFVEAGGNFLDTADFYAGGRSEQFLGEMLANDRDRFVVGTKYSLTRDSSDPNAAGNHRKNLMRAVEASLVRLQTDYIDVLWLHQWDFFTPVTEVLRALDDLVRAGKVLYLGLSDTPAWVVARANTLAEERNWTPFVATQLEYSLVERTIEREFVPMCQMLDIAITAWSPLAGGVLSGKYSDGIPAGARFAQRAPSERQLEIARAAATVATDLDTTTAAVALAWVRSRPGVVIPIVGARTEAQLKENLEALTVTLSDDHMARLDAASAIDAGFPARMLGRLRSTPMVWGNSLIAVDNHRVERSGLPIDVQVAESRAVAGRSVS
jgi:aryl-alcohol dehydrogenase-like predicted oxidoreductase